MHTLLNLDKNNATMRLLCKPLKVSALISAILIAQGCVSESAPSSSSVNSSSEANSSVSSATSSQGTSSSSSIFSSSSVNQPDSSSSSSSQGSTLPVTKVTPLFDESTALEAPIQYETDTALITRFSDRGRDRHAKENHFQAYDHFLTFYWENRTISVEIIDEIAKGGDRIRMNVRAQGKLDRAQAENRWFYWGQNTLAEYCSNLPMTEVPELDDPANDIYHYFREGTLNCREGHRPIQIGDKLEFEISQFLDQETLARGRDNYYGTTYLYIVGEGLVPWDTEQTGPQVGGVPYQRDSKKIPESAWLGGDTSIHAQETAEYDGHYMQMATNIGYDNGQPFVLGRRVHHTSFTDGAHNESDENGIWEQYIGLAGNHYINHRCTNCHTRNGAAAPAEVGEPLDKWVFKVGDGNGNPDPNIGRVLQPRNNSGASEGNVSIAEWVESNGLRSPVYSFSNGTPAQFSARISPRLVGLGLLEAIPEDAILALADEHDENNDGISGKASLSPHPLTGETHLGRFGWKAGTVSVKHQVAGAFNTDMGVTSSLLPNPDCGVNQADCGAAGAELDDEALENLTKYVSLLGIRPMRNYDDAEVLNGQQIFRDMNCTGCHTETFQTSEFHPLGELRNQTIHPYSDMLLHDMGPGLADNLGEGNATGAEWRTTPLWGLGTQACVTGGVAGETGDNNSGGVDGGEYCTPVHSYLHDGRARTIEEAILWHGGEGEASKNDYVELSENDKQAVLKFLESI